jgi:hypothetical protein
MQAEYLSRDGARMGRSLLGDLGLWKLREDGATGGAHEARKGTGTSAGSEPGDPLFIARWAEQAYCLTWIMSLVFPLVELGYFKFDKYFSRKNIILVFFKVN